MFKIPYRWLPRTIIPNITSMYWDIHYGIINIFKFIPVIWFDRWWDWTFLTSIMEFKLFEMANKFKDQGHHVSANKDARNMLICATLLKRLREDNYWKEKNEEYRARYDQEYCFNLMGKHLRKWWD